MNENNKSENYKKQRPSKYDAKVSIKGDFLDVFKVVKKHKEQNTKKP